MITKGNNRATLADIRPLVVSTQPYVGEYLSSVLVRACEANVFAKTSQLLKLIGLRAQASEAIPFTYASESGAIARLLGTTVEEIECRMHPLKRDDRGRSTVRWYDGTIERRHIEAAVRRYAPRSLEQRKYSPGAWSIRLLDYCPLTLEHLLSLCPQCSSLLGWRACRSIWKCDKCGASLLTAESRRVPAHLHKAAHFGAALVDSKLQTREAALASLGDPLRNWDPTDALEGLLTLGAAKLWLEASESSNEPSESAACIAAGMEFVRQWPDSLSNYVKVATDRTQSTSVRVGIGPLGRLFDPTARNTPIRDLVRSRISISLSEAVVPAKLQPGAIVDDACRSGKITALVAVSKLGINLRSLRRLEGRSKTFLARHAVKGGVALYDEAAISHLATVLRASSRHRDAARLIGIPSHCIDALMTAGLVTPVSDPDAIIVTEAPLVTDASIFAMRERLQKRSRKITNGLALRTAMRRVGDPHDWAAVFQALQAGHIDLQFDATEDLAISDAVIVRADDVTRRLARRIDGPGISGVDVCCQTAAEIIGTTAQFVAAAAKVGFIDGEVGLRNSAIPLGSVLMLQGHFILTDELRETFGRHPKTIATELRNAGLKPAVTINRTNVWRRSDIQQYIVQRRNLPGQTITAPKRTSRSLADWP